MSTAYLNGTTRQERLGLADARLYLATGAMVLGNVALPALVHGLPNGGRMLLPIFFFTLIAGWRFGVAAAVLTAVLSPLANHVLTGMPPTPMLAGIIGQSAALGLVAWVVASHTTRTTLPLVALVVVLHQALLALPALSHGGLMATLGALQLRSPGLLLQILGGFAVLRLLERWLPTAPARS